MYTTDLVWGVPWCLPEAKANTLGKNTASTLGLKEFLQMYFQGIWIHSQKSNAHTKSKYHEQKPAETDSRIRPAKTQTSARPFLPEAAEIKCNHSLTEQFNLSYLEVPTALSSLLSVRSIISTFHHLGRYPLDILSSKVTFASTADGVWALQIKWDHHWRSTLCFC